MGEWLYLFVHVSCATPESQQFSYTAHSDPGSCFVSAFACCHGLGSPGIDADNREALCVVRLGKVAPGFGCLHLQNHTGQ